MTLLSIGLICLSATVVLDIVLRLMKRKNEKRDPSDLVEMENTYALRQLIDFVSMEPVPKRVFPSDLHKALRRRFGEQDLLWLQVQFRGHTIIWRTDSAYHKKNFPHALAMDDATRNALCQILACSKPVYGTREIRSFFVCDDAIRIGDDLKDLSLRPGFARYWEVVKIPAIHPSHIGRVVIVC